MDPGNTRVAKDEDPWVAVCVTVLAIVCLSTIEGQRASLIGLPPVEPDLYKDSHPITYKNAALAFKGNSLDRYLVGRQFMVIKRCTSLVLDFLILSSSTSFTLDLLVLCPHAFLDSHHPCERHASND